MRLPKCLIAFFLLINKFGGQMQNYNKVTMWLKCGPRKKKVFEQGIRSAQVDHHAVRIKKIGHGTT